MSEVVTQEENRIAQMDVRASDKLSYQANPV